MSNSTDAVQDAPSTPIFAALAGILPDDAAVPVRLHPVPGGIVAAYNPAAETRASVWQLLTELFGDLIDVTPANVLAAVA